MQKLTSVLLLLLFVLSLYGIVSGRGDRENSAIQNPDPVDRAEPGTEAVETAPAEPEPPAEVSMTIPVDFALYEEIESGTLYLSDDSFLYLPEHIFESTQTHVYFAGGVGGFMITKDDLIQYLEDYQPTSVMLWFINSSVWSLAQRTQRTADLLMQIWNWETLEGRSVVMTGSSYGGYTALAVAADLKSGYGLITPTISILDMGNDWGEIHDHFTDAQADVLREMGTVIYHFGKRGGAQNPWGAQEFLAYEIPVVEIKSKSTEHDQVTHYAFRRGLFSWMTGERELDPEWYTETWRSF